MGVIRVLAVLAMAVAMEIGADMACYKSLAATACLHPTKIHLEVFVPYVVTAALLYLVYRGKGN